MKTPSPLACALGLLILRAVATASPGGLDATFAGSGKVTASFSAPASANGITVQADGEIVAVGGAGDDAIVARYTAGGGVSGLLIGKFDSVVNRISFNSVAVQSGANVVAAGTAYITVPFVGSGNRFALFRWNANGSLDGRGFPGRGVNGDYCEDLALQSDGKILLDGFGGVPADFELVRLNTDLLADTTFTGSQFRPGSVITDFATQVPFTVTDDQIKSIALQNDGKIVAAGFTFHTGEDFDTRKIALARYLPDGNLDMTFNNTGKVITTVGFRNDRASSVAVQVDGKVLVAGTSVDASSISKVVLVRYNPDGSLDLSFNNTGIVFTTMGTNSSASGMALQPDGRIVVAGTSDNDFLVARYYGNGDLEGSVTTDFASSIDEAHAVALQGDGGFWWQGRQGLTSPSRDTFPAMLRRHSERSSSSSQPA